LKVLDHRALEKDKCFYRADPFQIDLLIEFQVGGRTVLVSGQLLDLRHPEIVGDDLPTIWARVSDA
jgi:hypothetical protein